MGPHPHFGMLGSSETYFVTLKIRSNLRARNTLMPKEVPGLMTAQMTSKMLPMMTWAGGGGSAVFGLKALPRSRGACLVPLLPPLVKF